MYSFLSTLGDPIPRCCKQTSSLSIPDDVLDAEIFAGSLAISVSLLTRTEISYSAMKVKLEKYE